MHRDVGSLDEQPPDSPCATFRDAPLDPRVARLADYRVQSDVTNHCFITLKFIKYL
jgi:hypothetical protein